MASTRIDVSPAVLIWARQTAGLSQSDAARRLGVSEDVLRKWEGGQLAPTLKQLRGLAARYARPLAALFLPSPPPEQPPPVTDFRRPRTAGIQLPDAWSYAVRIEVRRVLDQRRVLEELRRSPSAIRITGRPPQFDKGLDPERAGLIIRKELAFDEFDSGIWSRPLDTFNAIESAVERAGILVVQTQGVPLSEMKGFSLALDPFPIIALNGSDWPRPKTFTLLHEVCHIALRISGMCDLHESSSKATRAATDEIEHYCNQVAAAALMPKTTFVNVQEQLVASDPEWHLPTLQRLGGVFGVSGEAALLRLVGLGLAEWALYWAA